MLAGMPPRPAAQRLLRLNGAIFAANTGKRQAGALRIPQGTALCRGACAEHTVGRRRLRPPPDRGRDPMHGIVGDGHVLRPSQTENNVFCACSFERIEHFCRFDGSFDNHLEFTDSEPDGRAANPPARSTLRQLQATLPLGRESSKRGPRAVDHRRPPKPDRLPVPTRLRLALGTRR
jgi:hypothetical protein